LLIKLNLIAKMEVAEITNRLRILYASVTRIVKNATIELLDQVHDCLPDE